MSSFLRRCYYWLHRLILKIPGLSTEGRSLSFLNIAQFLGVINDNYYKLVMVFLLIELLGRGEASSILSFAGALYVIPFLLFSSAAGILADKFSKQRMLVAMKGMEIAVMLLVLWAFAVKNVWGCYSLLFLLSLQSTLFGPPKYGIIAELVPRAAVAKANGLITSFTYLGILFGTFSASLLTDITHYNFMLLGGISLLIALAGFVASFGIKKTPPQRSPKKLNPLFISEILRTLLFSRTKKHLLPAIFGSAFFLFLGAYTQLNVIPFAMSALGLSEVAGGYLFLSTALGIALGAVLAGRASRKQVELGLSCFAGFAMALLFFSLYFFSHDLVTTTISLLLLGMAGGMFIVPFDTFMQLSSPDEKRGQVIAASNFLGFSGVLLASLALYVFSEILALNAAKGFGVVAGITLFVSLIFFFRLSDYGLSFFSRKVLKPLLRVRVKELELAKKKSDALFILPDADLLDALLLLAYFPEIRFFRMKNRPAFWSRLFYQWSDVPSETSLQEMRGMLRENELCCLLLSHGQMPQKQQSSPGWKELLKIGVPEILYVKIERGRGGALIRFTSDLIS